MRTNFDFTPYRRSMIGFDRLFDALENATRAEPADNYPPFDIEKLADDRYRISVAVAGFSRDEIELTAQQNLLVVSARKAEEAGQRQFLHRGIAARAFERRFELADFVQVKDAELKDGLLVVTLQREIPEAMRPRRIEINGESKRQTLSASEEQREAA